MAIFDLKANIDLKQNLNIYTTCKQLDSLNLILSVFDNSVQTNLTNYNVRLKAMKADKVPLVQEHTGISISGNVITIETDEQFTTTSGKTLIELQFIDEVTGKKKATFNLVLIVVSTTLEVERGISKATYTLLEELENKLDQASDFFENIEDAIVANNNLKKTISNSETAESNLETAITNANNKKNEVDEAITIATNKIEEVEQSIINANNSKTELDASKTIADTTKIDLDNANVQAEKNIEELNKLGDATDLAAKVQTNTENISKNNKSIEEVNSHLNERMKDILSITKNIQGKNVKFIGDSIVAGYGGTGYLLDGETIYDTYNVNTSGHCWANSLKNYLETNLSCKVKNYGIGGLKSTDIVNHLSDLIKTEDDIILCMIGNNDRKVVNGDTVLYNNLKTIYNYVNNLNKKIIFISQPPCTLEEDALRYLGMDKIENAIMKATSELNIEYISCYKLFIEYMENKNYSLNDLLCSDGSHPNDVGYDVMYYLILSKLGFAKFNSLDSISDSGWINLPLGVAIAGTLEPQYRKVGKLISFRGYFTNISGRSSLVGTLPEGFKPSTVKYLKILSNDTLIAKLQILSNGQIYIQYDANNYASGTYYSLDDAIFLIG